MTGQAERTPDHHSVEILQPQRGNSRRGNGLQNNFRFSNFGMVWRREAHYDNKSTGHSWPQEDP